jgi:hypothetical protein
MAIRETLVAIAVLAGGCTPQAYLHDANPDHPAHPGAQVGMLPGPSTTLAIGDAHSADVEGGMPQGVGSEERIDHGAGGAEADPREAEGALYQCPMHPKVTSRDPQRRCPKCNMKINKPVKDDGSTPPGREGHGGHSQ